MYIVFWKHSWKFHIIFGITNGPWLHLQLEMGHFKGTGMLAEKIPACIINWSITLFLTMMDLRIFTSNEYNGK